MSGRDRPAVAERAGACGACRDIDRMLRIEAAVLGNPNVRKVHRSVERDRDGVRTGSGVGDVRGGNRLGLPGSPGSRSRRIERGHIRVAGLLHRTARMFVLLPCSITTTFRLPAVCASTNGTVTTAVGGGVCGVA